MVLIIHIIIHLFIHSHPFILLGPNCHRYTKVKPLSKDYRPQHPRHQHHHPPHQDHKQGRKTSPDNHHHHHVPAYCERWEDMVTDVDYFFEWAVANRLNKVEWLLLGNYKWGENNLSRVRRLETLTQIGHQYSLLIGQCSTMQ